jgi:hypothetical protein
VGDVGAIEALALLDERLRPDHFFDRTQMYRQIEDELARGVLEPTVVDVCHAVTRAIDDVDEVVVAVGFAEPVRERHVGVVASPLQSVQRGLEVSGFDEYVEVLGVALDAGITREGVGPADEHVDAGLFQDAQRVAIELACLGIEHRLRPRLG